MHRSLMTFLASKRWNALPPKVRESQDIASFNRSFEAVRVKDGMSLRNGMWHGLRNDIIMRNVIYAE